MKRPKKLPPYSADEIAADPDLAAGLVRESEPLLAIERQIKLLREQKADLFDDLRLSRYKPEFAKAWVAAQMPDEEKDALRAEKAIELARVVAAMDVAKANGDRARAGARDTRKPAARQDAFDNETGEVLGDAPAPAGEPMVSIKGQEPMPISTFAAIVTAKAEQARASTPLRTLPPRIPEPAPEMPDLPAFLDRRNERTEAAQ